MDQRTLSFLLYVEGLVCNDTNRLEQGVQSFSQARDLLEAAMKQETRTPMDPKNLSHIYSSMGNALTSSNRFVAAEECQRKAISLYLAAGEIVESRLGRLYANLGSCLLWKGDLVAAEAILHKALLQYDRKLCCTLYTLGNVYLAQKCIQRAYEVHLEILEIFSKRLGRSHPVTADSCFKVGCILSREDFPNANLSLAEAYLRKALAVYEASASKANQDSEILVARAQFKLATVVERSQAVQAAQAAPADACAHAPGIDTSIAIGTGTGDGGELDLLVDVAAGRVSPAELRELGLQTLQRRLGPDQPIPSDVDAIMGTFDRLLFYWSR
jgi:tetratricopeptide (TPR) repeat protein